VQDGRRNHQTGQTRHFEPRKIEFDSIIVQGKTGHVNLSALKWLSHHNVPIFFLDFDGSIISSILPPTPIKADLRVAQVQAASDSEKKFQVAHAFVKAKIARSLEVLDWLGERYDIEQEVRMAKGEASKLGEAKTVNELRTVEGRTALRYWEAFAKVMPKHLGFRGRMVNSRNSNAVDCVNASLNYGYGFLQIEVRKAVNSVGLEPAVGFLHEIASSQTAESLVYDLEEPFRFLIDTTVVKAFETDALNPSHFAYERDDYLYRIQPDGTKRLLDLLREQFNSGIVYKGQRMKWDTVIEEKAFELSRFLTGKAPSIDFEEPSPVLERTDSRDMRERILTLNSSKAKELGIQKSTLHYLRQRAEDGRPFTVYEKVREKLEATS
jgi:CRISPR-associated protein Cas1